jgi:hypothetical protein
LLYDGEDVNAKFTREKSDYRPDPSQPSAIWRLYPARVVWGSWIRPTEELRRMRVVGDARDSDAGYEVTG